MKSMRPRRAGRSIALLVPWVLLLAAWATCAQATAPIQSGCELDYPPFCFVQADNTADGFSVELLVATLEKMGHEVAFRTGPWAQVRGWLERGEIDALPLVGRTPEREALFDFTVPYLTMHGAIVVRQGVTDIRTLEDLRNRVVGVMAGDNAEEFLRREPRDFDIVTRPTFADAFHLLADGGCDAVVIQRLVAVRLIDELGLASTLRIVDQPVFGFSQDFCFAVTEGNYDLLSILNEGLALAMADGTHRRLYAKWFAHMQLPSDRAIVVGGDANYPPFEYLDENGRPAGYNVDLIRAVAQATGLTIEIRLGHWSSMVQALENGDIDALQGMFYSTARDETLDFSQAHMVNHCIAVVRKGEGLPPSSDEDLAGKRIVVQEGDIMHAYAVEHGFGDALTTVTSQEDALRELAAGTFDCALVSRITALYWIDQNGWRNLEVGRTPLLSAQYCFAVPEGSKPLLAEFSEGLAVIEQSGEYQTIYEKWMGVYDPSLAAQRTLKYVVIIAAALAIFLLLVLVWLWSLRRQVRRRTDQLHESTEFQRAVVACSPVALYTLAFDGKVLTWNASSERIFGWAAEETVGQPLPTIPDTGQDEFAALRLQVQAGESFAGKEVKRQCRDGSLIDVRLSAAPVRDKQGVMVALMSAAEDITERKQNEIRIDHLNRVLRAIRDVNQLITHETDREALLRRSCEILTSTRGYRSAWVAVHNNEGEVSLVAESGIGDDFALVQEALTQGVWPPCHLGAHKQPDGMAVIHNTETNCTTCPLSHTYRETAALAGVLRFADQEYGVLVVALPTQLADDAEEQALFKEMIDDIAYALHALELGQDRQRAEAELKAEKEWSERLITNAPNIVVGLQERSRIAVFNRFAEQLTGYRAEDVIGKEWIATFIPEEQRETIYQVWDDIVRNQLMDHHFENELITRSGERRLIEWYNTIISEDGEFQLILSLGTDITDRRRAEEALKRSETSLKEAQRVAAIGSWSWNIGTGELFMSDQMYKIIGLPKDPETLDVAAHEKYYTSESWQRFLSAVECARETGESYEIELKLVRESGGNRHTIARGEALTDEGGRVVALRGTLQDITERKRTEQTLSESEEKYRTLVGNMRLGVVIAQIEPVHLRFANPAMSDISGYDEAELLAMDDRTLPVLIHPDDRARFFGNFRKRIAGEDVAHQAEYRIIRKDGTTRWVSLYSSLVDYFGEKATLTSFVDITDRKQAEEEKETIESQLRQSQKMDAVGRLAGGVAHDFNNLLMGILNYADLCRDDIGVDHPSRKWLDEITREAERSATLTRQLLAFARKQTMAPRPLHINDGVTGILRMLRRLIGEHIDLIWKPCASVWTIEIDPGQLDQILANLCVNARDAMGTSGKLTIETHNSVIGPEYCTRHAEATPGDYVMLVVSDDGHGMDAQTLERVFEPFFTTKDVGEGTGLGLATVYGIVKQNGGFVNVYSEPSEGTTFRIYLPRVEGASASAPTGHRPGSASGGDETILLVEDEASIRETVGILLQRLGYTVLSAEDPSAALQRVADHQGPIHLLITDVVMPGMSGRDLAEQLLEDAPDLKVLYMSGYTANVIAHLGILEEGVHFVSKPISGNDLAHKVREVLSTDNAGRREKGVEAS